MFSGKGCDSVRECVCESGVMGYVDVIKCFYNNKSLGAAPQRGGGEGAGGQLEAGTKVFPCRSRSALGHARSHWAAGSGSHAARPPEQRSRSRVSTVIQPLRQNAAEVVDLTVDEDGELPCQRNPQERGGQCNGTGVNCIR